MCDMPSNQAPYINYQTDMNDCPILLGDQLAYQQAANSLLHNFSIHVVILLINVANVKLSYEVSHIAHVENLQNAKATRFIPNSL